MNIPSAARQPTSAASLQVARLINFAFALLALYLVATIGLNLDPAFDDSDQDRTPTHPSWPICLSLSCRSARPVAGWPGFA